jgi:hypothetical protein
MEAKIEVSSSFLKKKILNIKFVTKILELPFAYLNTELTRSESASTRQRVPLPAPTSQRTGPAPYAREATPRSDASVRYLYPPTEVKSIHSGQAHPTRA